MKIIKKELNLFPCAVVAALAAIYLAWQLIGLRYTNHDDIYLHLNSWVFSGDYLSFAKNVAYKQARLQAYINMPIILWLSKLSNSVLFDILNIGTFGILYLSLIWVLGKIGSLRDSLVIAAVTLFLFPLHYYFTFPQGYPVMASWGLTFAFISAGLLGSYLQQPKLWKLLISALLFSSSLWGPEYNFILHPALLLVVFLVHGKTNFMHLRKTAWPYAIGWAISVAAYFYFSIVSRQSGADVSGRVSVGFDFIAWLKTFLILLQKSFLPSALWGGINLSSASTQGSPEIPAPITYSSLWHETHDWGSTAVVFILTLIIFAMILYRQKFPIKSIGHYSIFFACLTIFPCLVVAGSSHYQLIVLKGYLQGHLVSFYSQLGLSGLVFLLLTYICNTFSRDYLKLSALALSAVILAGFATVTFIYNNANRQVMIANKQKWEAMRELTSFVQSDRPDLKERVFYAPAFWSASGVSSIPGASLFNGENYWSEYAKKVLNSPIKITSSDSDLANNALIVNYFSTPAGIPVVILSERKSENQQWVNTLIASRPVVGTLSFQHNDNRTKKVAFDQWKCAKQCVSSWDENLAIQPASIDFDPDDHGSTRLLVQFMTSRGSEYAHPLGRHSKNESIDNLNDLKILNWGPQGTVLGVVPNPQPNGDAGIWIKISGGAELGDAQVMFDGQTAKSTSLGTELITASISAESFSTPGEKDIYIKQVITGKLFSVGKFNVASK